MADAPDLTRGCTSSKRPAKKEVKRCKYLPQRLKRRPKERARVDIGLAFQRWREMKKAYRMRSDAEVALHLLDVMKRLPSSPVSPGESDKKIKFSQNEVQTLIEQEVCSAVKKNETTLQGLVESIQQLDRAVDYESTIRKLEARINAVTQQAEAALAYMEKKKSPPPSLTNGDVRLDSEDEKVDMSQNKNCTESKDKSGELFEIMETTKKALNKMHDANKALSAAVLDLREETTPTVLGPRSSPKCMNLVRTDPEEGQEKENNFEASKKFEEPKADKVEKCPPPGDSNSLERTSSDQMRPLYPPLPSTTFPSTLNMEAASYNIPQKLVVRLALIRNPPNLSVLWNVAEKDPSAPPMYSYSVLMSMEKAKGSGVFSKWTTVGEVTPIPLPICVMISKYKPGHKVCVAVVGKDKFCRYGPYSEVVTATIPD